MKKGWSIQILTRAEGYHHSKVRGTKEEPVWAHEYDFSTWLVEAEQLEVQGHPWLAS